MGPICPVCTHSLRSVSDRGVNHLLAETSVHPMENGTRTHPMNPEFFVGRCLFLQDDGFNMTVNIVAWPENEPDPPPGRDVSLTWIALPCRPALVDCAPALRVASSLCKANHPALIARTSAARSSTGIVGSSP